MKPNNFKKTSRLIPNLKMLVFDFDGIFTTNQVLVLQDGTEGVLCNRSDGIGVKAVESLGIQTLVISAEPNPVVSVRCKKLGIACIQNQADKLTVLRAEAKKRRINLSEIAYIGNDTNDLECLKAVGFPVCVNDALPAVKKVCLMQTRLDGGKGAVRELCDFIVKIRKTYSVPVI